MIKQRIAVALIGLSASGLVGIALNEGYRGQAYQPVPGDVPTIGFGTTDGVKPGDKITPEKALQKLMLDASKYEGALKKCVTVKLTQAEYDAYVSLAYNIGPVAFCGSTLVKKLNAEDYVGACGQILRWDSFKGKKLPGLTSRRQAEHRQCMEAFG